jgi:hypothetical protein
MKISLTSRISLQDTRVCLDNFIHSLPVTIDTLDMTERRVTGVQARLLYGIHHKELMATGSLQKHVDPEDTKAGSILLATGDTWRSSG